MIVHPSMPLDMWTDWLDPETRNEADVRALLAQRSCKPKYRQTLTGFAGHLVHATVRWN